MQSHANVREYSTAEDDNMRIKIQGKYYRCMVPVAIQRALDESLDGASVNLRYTKVKDAFAPFTPAFLRGEKWYIAADVCEQIPGRKDLYNHSLTLIEETAALQKMYISSKVVTRQNSDAILTNVDSPAKKEVLDERSGVAPYDQVYKIEFFVPDYYPAVSAIYRQGSALPSPAAVRGREYTAAERGALNAYLAANDNLAAWAEIDGEIIESTKINQIDKSVTVNVDIGKLGRSVTMHYVLAEWIDPLKYNISEAINHIAIYDVQHTIRFASRAETPPGNATAFDVAEQLIEDVEQLRHGDTPTITIDDEARTKLAAITAPEYAFTAGMSLWECFNGIGNWIGGVPKLVNNQITFKFWGSTKHMPRKGRMVYNKSSTTAADYCTAIESRVTNLVDDTDAGVLADPFGYRTMRAEDTSIAIDDDTFCIYTEFPIWRPVSISIGYVGKLGKDVGDITAYLYERTEYDLLSNFGTDHFPRNKAYALYYTQGQKGIRGVSFTQKDTEIFGITVTSIENIIAAKFGLERLDLSTTDRANLLVHVEYIPIVEMRVREHKSQAAAMELAMAYNQSGGVINSTSWGEHLRAKALMVGTTQRSVSYIYKDWDDVPTPGLLYDDDSYINIVVAEYYPGYARATLHLSEQYNRSNRFVGIDKTIRKYEIPIDSVTRRELTYCDYLILGKPAGSTGELTSARAESDIVAALVGGTTTKKVNAAFLGTGSASDATDVTTVVLPVITSAIGTAATLHVEYVDNYSAGNRSSVSTIFGIKKARRLQIAEKYSDEYGRAKYLWLSFDADASAPTVGSSAIQAGHDLPRATNLISRGIPLVSTGNKPIILNKDAREKIAFTYQLHTISNDGYIISPAFAKTIPFVNSKTESTGARLFVYRQKINALRGTSQAIGSGYTLEAGKTGATNYIAVKNYSTHKDEFDNAVAWAIVKDGEFLFGKNGSVPDKIYFNFRHKPDAVADIDAPVVPTYFINFSLVGCRNTSPLEYVQSGDNYSARIEFDAGYNAPNSISVTAGTSYTWDKNTGILTLTNVTQDTTVQIYGILRQYTVTTKLTKATLTGATTANHYSTYNAILLPEERFAIIPESISIKVGGVKREVDDGYTYNAETGDLTIPDITGNISIVAAARTTDLTITMDPFTSVRGGTFTIFDGAENHSPSSVTTSFAIKLGTTLKMIWVSAESILTVSDDEQDWEHEFARDDLSEIYEYKPTASLTLAFEEREREKHTVSYTLQNCTADTNAKLEVFDLNPLSFTLTAADGYRLPDNVTVTMDGIKLSTDDYVYDKSNGRFRIKSVTGNVTIYVPAIKVDPIPPSSYNVVIMMEYKHDGNIMGTKTLANGQYVTGTKFTAPRYSYLEESAGTAKYETVSGSDEVITVGTSDINETITYQFVEYAVEPTPTYNVKIEVTYYDADGNFEESVYAVNGQYEDGKSWTFPQTITREMSEGSVTYTTDKDYTFTVDGADITASIDYTREADTPVTETYHVTINVYYYSYSNDLISSSEDVNGYYESGTTFTYPGTTTYGGQEYTTSDGEDVTITVGNSDVTEGVLYSQSAPPYDTTYNVGDTFDVLDVDTINDYTYDVSSNVDVYEDSDHWTITITGAGYGYIKIYSKVDGSIYMDETFLAS